MHQGIEKRKDKISKTLKAQITEINRGGKVTIMFNQDIVRVANISWINSTSLNLEFIDKSSTMKNFTWKILTLSHVIMEL